MIKFSSTQTEAIRKGVAKRNSLIRAAKKAASRARAVDNIRGEEYLDTILAGTTGIGKTYNVESSVQGENVAYQVIQGNISMFAFGTNLMYYHHVKPKGEKMVLIIDDCDTFFENKENINLLKSMTGKPGTRRFQYNKMVLPHLLTDIQRDILPNYVNLTTQGFTVPCDDFIFIFTTNFALPYESDAKDYMEKHGGTSKANRMSDLSAIRGRLNTTDYMLERETNWGWIAEVALNDGGLDMLPDLESKMILLDWMWHNWADMTETNLRTIEKMAYEMLEYPDEYRDNWEADFLK